MLRPPTQAPADVLEAARAVFAWRTVDAELATLSFDSLVDAGASGVHAVDVRSMGQPRILAFDAGGLTVEVEVDETPGSRRIVGQLTPAGAAELELRTAGVPVTGEADELGGSCLPCPPTASAAACAASLRVGRSRPPG